MVINKTVLMGLQNMLPAIWILGSATCFVAMQIFIKLLSEDLSILYIICLRSILLLTFNSYIILTSQEYQPYQIALPNDKKIKYFSIHIKNRKYFILMLKRIFWNACQVNTILVSIKYVNLSILNAMFNTTPVLNFFVEAVFYKKSIKPLNLVISIICFLGIIIILDPISSFDSKQPFNWYILLPLFSALSSSLSYIYLHQMRAQIKEIIVLQYAYTTHLLSSGLSIMVFGSLDHAQKSINVDIFFSIKLYAFMALIVLFAYGTNFLKIMAIFKRKPSQILAFNYFGIIFSILMDKFLFKSQLKLMTIIGVLLTGAGLLSQVFINLFNKQTQQTH